MFDKYDKDISIYNFTLFVSNSLNDDCILYYSVPY